MRLLIYLIGGLAAGSLVVAGMGFGRDYLYARLITAVLNDLRSDMFDHLQRLSIGFFTSNRTGDVLARFSTDLAAIEKAGALIPGGAVIPSLDVLLSTILLFLLNWKLALMSLLVWPLMIAGPTVFTRRLVEESDRRTEEEGRVLGLVQENFHAQIVIQTFGLAKVSRTGFLDRLGALAGRMIRVAWLSSLVERSACAGIMVLQVGLLAAGAFMVSRGRMTVGGLASFQAIFLSLSNSIAVDDRDIREFPLEEFRSLFGFVPQESLLFDISIRENIRLGNTGATDAQVEAAAKAAEVHDAILRLPQGYDTRAGERGSRMSGGQRQRIALARALVRNPAILVLDEVTSALDPIAEAAIRSTIERLRPGRTIVSVTHRLSGVMNADRIIVLDHGRLTQQGTHAELVNHEGPYRNLWTKQHGFLLDAARHHAEISIDRLRLVPVFYGMPDRLLSEAVRLFQTEEFPQDHIVIREGEIGASLYIIVRGTVDLTSEHDGDSRPVRLEDGDCFGERALLDAAPEMETVRTLSPCVFLKLNRAAYNYLKREMPQSALETDPPFTTPALRATPPL